LSFETFQFSSWFRWDQSAGDSMRRHWPESCLVLGLIGSRRYFAVKLVPTVTI